MFCHQCGSAVSDDAVTCGSCGADLRSKNQGETQPIAAPDATIRMAPVSSVPVPEAHGAGASSSELAPTTLIAVPGDAATAKIPVAANPPKAYRSGVPLVLLFVAAVVVSVVGVNGYQWWLHRNASSDGAAQAGPASAPTVAPPAAPAASAPAPVEPQAADPAALAPPPSTVDAPATGPGSGPALLAAAKKERDAAIVQRDAALAQVKQLQDDLDRARAAAAAPVAPAAPPPDTAKLAQLQKDHDTVQYIVGSRKQLLADKVIESHLYMLPPPTGNLTTINLAQTTDISFDAKAYGINDVKEIVVIPSSVWPNTDYKTTISGSQVKFSILRPDAFRTLARYFVLMVQ